MVIGVNEFGVLVSREVELEDRIRRTGTDNEEYLDLDETGMDTKLDCVCLCGCKGGNASSVSLEIASLDVLRLFFEVVFAMAITTSIEE